LTQNPGKLVDFKIETPIGYSCWIMHPSHRWDLPFLTINGFVDTDKHLNSLLLPFFIKEGFTGILPAGTPFAQIVPFKREDWSSSYSFNDPNTIYNNKLENSKTYRVPDGGVYKNKVWEKRVYL
jgi:hypothetical protein